MTTDERTPQATAPADDRDLRERLIRDLPPLAAVCMALLGDAREAEQALLDSCRRALATPDRPDPTAARSAIFGICRRECVRRLERRPALTVASAPAFPDPSTPTGARAALARLYPSARDALILRSLAGLDWADVARACGTDESTSRARWSDAVLQLVTSLDAGRTPAPTEVTAPRDPQRCDETRRAIASILDGSAGDSLLDHLTDCDACRDFRHAAERAIAVVITAGSDVAAPSDPEAWLGSASAGEPASGALEQPPTVVAAPEPTSPAASSAPPAAENAETDAPPANEPPADAPSASTMAAPSAATVASGSQEPAPRPKLDRAWVVGGALAIAALVGLAARAGSRDEPEDTVSFANARVERVSSTSDQSGFAACAPSGSPCQSLEPGASVPAGSRVKTDFATRATLTFAGGSRLSIERGSELRLGAAGDAPELLRGSFVAELRSDGSPAVLDVTHGSVRTHRGKIAIRTGAQDAVIEVARGTVDVRDRAGNEVTLHAGEQTRLGDGPPLAIASPHLGDALAWSDRLLEDSKEPVAPRGLGELAAKKPGTQHELEGAVRLTQHRVRVRISGAVARTEVEEAFTNTTGDVLEGIYRFPLPPDAKIERLALEVDGKLIEGAFVERDRAAAIWRGAIVNTAPQARALTREEIVWVPGPWRDPALLEWQRGGRFELRIFPIPKHGSRRIVLAYTELLRPAGETRRYTYPLAHDPSGSTRVDRFEFDVQVRGHDRRFPVRALGYDLSSKEEGELRTLTLTREGFTPSGDLSVEYALPERRAELSAWAYHSEQGSDGRSTGLDDADAASPYVALALRPQLPRAKEALPRRFAIVVDSSRSMFGESFERAKRVTARLVRELDPADRVVVLACDSDCRRAPDGLVEPGPTAERAVTAFLDSITPDGASDPTRAQALAYDALGSLEAEQGRIIYIGDGTPTMGPIRPDHIEASVARALPKDRVQVTAVAIGTDSDLETLGALARGGGGVVLPHLPGQSVSEAAYAVLGAAYGRTLRDVTVRLPDGLYAEAPARLDAIPAGGELVIVARMRDRRVDGEVVVTGDVSGQRFERRYPLRVVATEAKGNAFVPRLYAALRIADLERDGSEESRARALRLSTAFNVQSRYTSLLVLESEAMFRAFGLDNTRRAPEWSGEDDLETSVSESEFATNDAPGFEEESMAPIPGGAGLGTAGSGAPAAAPMRAGRGAPRPSGAEMADSSASAPSPAKPMAQKRREVPPGDPLAFAEPPLPPRRMIPMRRVWQRAGEITTARTAPKSASRDAILQAEEAAARDENRRELLRKLHALLAAASDLDRAERVLERWIARDPLDPDALTARADLAARRGDRELAIRLLGSVIDARPGDVGAQRRLERLHRWAGRAALGCRHLIAASEMRPTDGELLADAVRCARQTGETHSADRLLAAASVESRRKAETLLAAPAKDDSVLRGDLRVDAKWSGSADVDLALIGADGVRYSWFGAPTRSVISARDVTALGREGLAVRGAQPGEYVIEVVRGSGDGIVDGELTVTVAGTVRRIPFRLSGERATLGVAAVRMVSRLVPL